MNFLIIEYLKENEEEPFLTRSISVVDGGMTLKMLFLTYSEDIIKNLMGESHSTGDFITYVDEKCKIVNNSKVINSDTLYSELEYTKKATDIGIVQLATIHVSSK